MGGGVTFSIALGWGCVRFCRLDLFSARGEAGIVRVHKGCASLLLLGCLHFGQFMWCSITLWEQVFCTFSPRVILNTLFFFLISRSLKSWNGITVWACLVCNSHLIPFLLPWAAHLLFYSLSCQSLFSAFSCFFWLFVSLFSLLVLCTFQKSCIHVCHQHRERSITVIRQKEKENQSASIGDLGVYPTGMMVVRIKGGWEPGKEREWSGQPGLCNGTGATEGGNTQCTAWGRTDLLSDEEVETSVRWAEQEISGFLPCVRSCCGFLHPPS